MDEEAERAFVAASFQLEDFIATGHNTASIISQTTRKAIEDITKTNIRPTSVSRAPRSSTESTSSTASTRQRGPVEETTYPSEWAIDKASLRKAVARHERKLKDRGLLGPQQSKARKPTSPQKVSSPQKKASRPTSSHQQNPTSTEGTRGRSLYSDNTGSVRPLSPSRQPDPLGITTGSTRHLSSVFEPTISSAAQPKFVVPQPTETSASKATIKKSKSLFDIPVPSVEEESPLLEPGFGFPRARSRDNTSISSTESAKTQVKHVSPGTTYTTQTEEIPRKYQHAADNWGPPNPYRQGTRMSEQTQIDIEALLLRAARTAVEQYAAERGQAGPQGPAGNPGPRGEQGQQGPPGQDAGTDTQLRAVKAHEIGIFYPNVPSDWGTAPRLERDGRTYYRDVYAFTDRLKVIAAAHGVKLVQTNLDLCLKGNAELWWSVDIEEMERYGFAHAETGLNNFYKCIEKQFKPSPSDALNQLNSIKYTVADARNDRSVMEYMHSI